MLRQESGKRHMNSRLIWNSKDDPTHFPAMDVKSCEGRSSPWKRAEELGGWRIVWGWEEGYCYALNAPLGLLFPVANWCFPSSCLYVAFECQGKCPSVSRSFVVAELKCSWLIPQVPISNFSSHQALSRALGWWGAGLVTVKMWYNLLAPTKGELCSLKMPVLLYKRFLVFHSPVIWEWWGLLLLLLWKGQVESVAEKSGTCYTDWGLYLLIPRLLFSGVLAPFKARSTEHIQVATSLSLDLTGGCRVEVCSWF